jgi:hypothetical protein
VEALFSEVVPSDLASGSLYSHLNRGNAIPGDVLWFYLYSD